MKSKDIRGEIVWKESGIVVDDTRSRLARKIVLAVCVVCLLLNVYALGKLYCAIPKVQDKSAVVDPGIYFHDCKILREDCPDNNTCDLFSFCGEGSQRICKIYDCGDTYGVFKQDAEGNIDVRRKEKSDKIIVAEKKEACGGGMEIVDQKCSDGKMQVMVKIISAGDCRIGKFILLYEGTGSQPNKFTALKGNNYFITSETCGKITSIVPQTEEGIPIF